MYLTDYEQALLDGKHGDVKQKAMAVLFDLGKAYGVDKFIDIASCHDDSTVYFGEAQVAFAEHLAELGACFAVPTSTNACALDMVNFKEQRMPLSWASATRRIEASHTAMGAAGSWTCAPYQAGFTPRFGEQVAFAESNVIAWTNSILGARTNRYAGPIELLAGIVGKVPYFGLHMPENRVATGLIRLDASIKSSWFAESSLYNLLGHLHGEIAGDKIFAMDGMPLVAPMDGLKQFSATAASSGGIALFHLLGITPEAQSLEQCFAGKAPQEERVITVDDLRNAEAKLSNFNASDELDLISIGCPHFSFAEFVELEQLLAGRKVSTNLNLWVFTGRASYLHIESTGLLTKLQTLGVQVFRDGCTMEYPIKNWDTKSIMTNSGKFANYCFSKIGIHPVFGSIHDCVESAVSGKVIRSVKPWSN